MSTRLRVYLVVLAALALQLILGATSANAADCEPPKPEVPGLGLSGAIDPPALDHGDPVKGHYGKTSYAGTTWSDWSDSGGLLGCTELAHTGQTSAGNFLFNVGKQPVAMANGLWYQLHSQDAPLSKLDQGIAGGAKKIYTSVYLPYLGAAVLIAAVALLAKILSGDTRQAPRRVVGLLAGLFLASAGYLMPAVYTGIFDDFFGRAVTEIQASTITTPGKDPRNALPERLYNEAIYKTWLRGEFGSETSKLATEQGPKLLAAQAWSKTDTNERLPKDAAQKKQDEFKKVAEEVKKDQLAYGTFTGTDGSRPGTGLLGIARGIAFGLFPALAQIGQVLGEALMRVVVFTAPLLGLIIIISPAWGGSFLKGLVKAISNTLILAFSSALFFVALDIVLTASSDAWTQIMYMLIMSVMMLAVLRPIKRLKGIAGGAMTAVGMESQAKFLTERSLLTRAWKTERHMRDAHDRRSFYQQRRKSQRDSESSPAAVGDEQVVRPELREAGVRPSTRQHVTGPLQDAARGRSDGRSSTSTPRADGSTSVPTSSTVVMGVDRSGDRAGPDTTSPGYPTRETDVASRSTPRATEGSSPSGPAPGRVIPRGVIVPSEFEEEQRRKRDVDTRPDRRESVPPPAPSAPPAPPKPATPPKPAKPPRPSVYRPATGPAEQDPTAGARGADQPEREERGH